MPLVNMLKALADEKRLKIVKILKSSDLCVGALANRLGVSKPAVSQHLRILREAGLVKGEKRGYWTHYWVDSQALVQIASELENLAKRDDTCKTICTRIIGLDSPQPKSKEVDMCNCCQQPEKFKDKPEKCTPEQIRDCHGDVEVHPCACEKTDSDSASKE